MSKYGLQLRVKPSQQKQPTRPPLPAPLGFQDDDDDDVEREISRQASKNKALKDIEDQHRKALEEDPSVFDYDGVYDQMKEKAVQPRAYDREERKPKYIQNLMKKAQEREREQEIIYERKLAKERSKDDHLYAGKDKFVTSAYKKKLAEQAKWMEEERLRQLREEKEDVTKKSDITDFYFNLQKNIAYGARNAIEPREPPNKLLSEKQEKQTEVHISEKHEEGANADTFNDHQSLKYSNLPSQSAKTREEHPRLEEHLSVSNKTTPSDVRGNSPRTICNKTPVEEQPKHEQGEQQPKRDHHKRNEDAVAAAKERFLARKRAKEA
ncbi:nuclear speckle splicing regulatory protein 1-like [Benincasa hispida]|uniref:nuclear speckle splicing regulatory protein 1-like n=1 Tax=Benincasa hispida TaxID=102211 RepID=UPI001901AAD3|nr:nuclear speckle splicing regulatory protein 1-like [Benincasa hispida]XP_038877234.1 nuclear speckle splicing regulatory protein 1-like [Benincasa hispida]XP_038877235.1 nuclear speckle splicing regulatory protein 1-like [Benincasa hispida]